jgi:hypothetical protein
MGMGGKRHVLVTQYPLYRRLGGPQGRAGQVPKISPPPGFDPWTIQPVASHYTDYTIPAHANVHGTYMACLNSKCTDLPMYELVM